MPTQLRPRALTPKAFSFDDGANPDEQVVGRPSSLVTLALFRFYFPDVEVRIAGGRELHLRSLQPLGLMIANSIFAGDYLTTEGQPASADRQMIADLGFVVEGLDELTLPRDRPVMGAASHPSSAVPPVRLRHRGAGTDMPGNS